MENVDSSGRKKEGEILPQPPGAQPAADFRDLELTSAQLLPSAPEQIALFSTFHGQFEKYAVRVGGVEYLVKPAPHGYPGLPAMELTCNLLAKNLGLRVPRFGGAWVEGRLCFAAEQFVSALLTRHASANLNHLVKFFGETDTAGWTCARILNFLDREVSDAARARREFVEVCLFDALVGNADRHQRNLALLERPGVVELAPFYDNTSYLAMIPEEDALHLDSVIGCVLCEDSDSPRLPDYLREFRSLGLRAEVDGFVERLDEKRILDLIGASPLSRQMSAALGRFVGLRIREFRSS